MPIEGFIERQEHSSIEEWSSTITINPIRMKRKKITKSKRTKKRRNTKAKNNKNLKLLKRRRQKSKKTKNLNKSNFFVNKDKRKNTVIFNLNERFNSC